MVATITCALSRMNASWLSRRVCGFEARVIGQGANAIALQPLGELVDALAREAIHDARAAVAARALEHFRVGRLGLRPHGVVQVGPVEAGHVHARLAQRELPHDVLPDPLRGRGGERSDRYVGEARAQPMQLAVFRAEIVAPFRDAMRLVDDQRRNAVSRLQPRHDLAFEFRLQQPLRRDVQQLQLAALQPGEAPRHLRAIER